MISTQEITITLLLRFAITSTRSQSYQCCRESLKRRILVRTGEYEEAVKQVHDYAGIAEFDALVEQYAELDKKIKLQKKLLAQVSNS